MHGIQEIRCIGLQGREHGAAGGTRVRANTSMLVLVHGPGSGSAALAAESLLNTGKCRCDVGKVYVRCLYRR